MNFGSIVSLLSVDIFSMEQTGDKFKHICHWSGSDILPLPLRRVLPEKQPCVCGRVPEAAIGETTLGKETMDMRVPFQRSAESMEDTNEARDKVSVFVEFLLRMTLRTA